MAKVPTAMISARRGVPASRRSRSHLASRRSKEWVEGAFSDIEYLASVAIRGFAPQSGRSANRKPTSVSVTRAARPKCGESLGPGARSGSGGLAMAAEEFSVPLLRCLL
jgi:hypothetical protein